MKISRTRRKGSFKVSEQLNKADQVEENKPKDLSKLPADDFAMEDILPAWRKFVTDFESHGSISLYNALAGQDPERIDANTLKVLVVSEAQKNKLIGELPAFLDPMQKKLNNYHLKFEIDFIPEEEQKNKMFTPDDVYKYMLENYPDLRHMINELGLDRT